ncbi:MAG: hypothetical protein KME50_36275 [Nostoc desertorum CM1-VF14]|nr:hypothetical protein [Nostoc desertorum CM1-VF14]
MQYAWVELYVTQQMLENVGFCSSNATWYPAGMLKANKLGNRKGAVVPQPTQIYFSGLTQAH